MAYRRKGSAPNIFIVGLYLPDDGSRCIAGGIRFLWQHQSQHHFRVFEQRLGKLDSSGIIKLSTISSNVREFFPLRFRVDMTSQHSPLRYGNRLTSVISSFRMRENVLSIAMLARIIPSATESDTILPLVGLFSNPVLIRPFSMLFMFFVRTPPTCCYFWTAPKAHAILLPLLEKGISF